MKDVSADDGADGFDNTRLEKQQEQESLAKSARQTKRSTDETWHIKAKTGRVSACQGQDFVSHSDIWMSYFPT